jgi:hypothetical protein
MGGAIPPLPQYASWRGVQLGGTQGQLYLFKRSTGFKSYILQIIFIDLPWILQPL